jgi:ribosomal protein S18 acetylase RimI-like enzyme
MDDATFEAWRAASIRDYAQEKADAGNWPVDESLDRAEREFAALLPDGRDTAGHVIRSAVSDDGERVGMVWFAPEDRPFGRVAFIYDISIEPAHRRHGYGQLTLGAVEAFAREHGWVAVQLHVFGGNAAARRLYQRAGYIETNVTMLKSVID